MTYEQFFWFVAGYCNSQPDSEWAQTIKGVADTVQEVEPAPYTSPIMPMDLTPEILPDEDIGGFVDLLDSLPIEDLPVFGEEPIDTNKQQWELDDGKEREIKESFK